MAKKGKPASVSLQQAVEGEQAYFDLGYWSEVARDLGPVNDWDYWIHLPHLTPQEAACLLYGLDPNEYDNVASNNYPAPASLVRQIADIVRKATREQEAGSLLKNANSEEWAVWAEDSGYALLREWQARRDPSKIRDCCDAPKAPPENNPPRTGRGKGELHDLIRRAYWTLAANKEPSNSEVWNTLAKPEIDTSGIIQEQPNDMIFWTSHRGNEQKMKRRTFDNALSKIRKEPPPKTK